jgi:hypothetical protein
MIKSTKVDSKEPEQYPCLKKYIGEGNGQYVALFYKEGKAVVVNSSNSIIPVGYANGLFNEEEFVLYHGEVTLENM